jgi:hypothetical protein
MEAEATELAGRAIEITCGMLFQRGKKHKGYLTIFAQDDAEAAGYADRLRECGYKVDDAERVNTAEEADREPLRGDSDAVF